VAKLLAEQLLCVARTSADRIPSMDSAAEPPPEDMATVRAWTAR
jgi:hypothetical protein